MNFHAISGPNGKLSLGSEFNAARFRDYLKKNIGMRFLIEPLLPESNDQRRYFEGGVINLLTFYQENMDHRNSQDRKQVREWILTEFNGETVTIGGKSNRIAKTSKGQLNKGLLEKIVDWMIENYGQDVIKALEPNRYKHWRDCVYMNGGIDNYIDYLLDTKVIS